MKGCLVGHFLGGFQNPFQNWFMSIQRSMMQNVSQEPQIKSRIQEFTVQICISYEKFIGEMRKFVCREPITLNIWRGEYEQFEDLHDNNLQLGNLRKAAVVLKVGTGSLLPDGS